MLLVLVVMLVVVAAMITIFRLKCFEWFIRSQLKLITLLLGADAELVLCELFLSVSLFCVSFSFAFQVCAELFVPLFSTQTHPKQFTVCMFSFRSLVQVKWSVFVAYFFSSSFNNLSSLLHSPVAGGF